MTLISASYQQLNLELHAKRPDYGRRGGRHAGRVLELLKGFKAQSVLDWGCGKGGLKRALPGVDVREFDPAIPGKTDLPESADIVVCTDVLEHIEPECLESVLVHLQSLVLKAGHFVVATKPDGSKKLPDGRDPHLIVRPADWWFAKLSEYFRVRLEGEAKRDVTFTVRPL